MNDAAIPPGHGPHSARITARSAAFVWPLPSRSPAGTELAWTLRAVGGAVVDSGTTTAAADGLVAIAGLTIPKDPLRVRLEVRADAARPGDLNGDDAVNAVDLGILLSQWGNAGADLDGDGTTDARDLAIVLANWG